VNRIGLIKSTPASYRKGKLSYEIEIWSCGSITTFSEGKDVNKIEKWIKEAIKMKADVNTYVQFCINEYGF
jgi:hypothetical protein